MPDLKTIDAIQVADAKHLQAGIIAAFGDVFKHTNIQPHSDFFDLGGDSLSGEQLAMSLSRRLDIEFPVSGFFDHATPFEITDYLMRNGSQKVVRSTKRPPIFLVHGASGFTMPKPAFFQGLAEDQDLVLLELPGLTGSEKLPHTVEEIAAAYVKTVLNTVFENEAIHLAAFCNGGFIALEMAHQIKAAGREIDHLVLLDPFVPSSINRVHLGQPAGWDDRLGFFLFTGRLSGGASKRDIEDKRLHRIHRRLLEINFALKYVRYRLTGHKARGFKEGVNIKARAALLAAYLHYWPKPYHGTADIICSLANLDLHETPGGFWQKHVPNRKVHQVIEEHIDITGAKDSAPAVAMQACFDTALANRS